MSLPIIPFQLLPLIVSFVSSLFLALMVFQNNPKSATNRIFALLAIILALWLVANYLSVDPSFLGYSLMLIRVSIMLATPVSALFFLLAYTIPNTQLTLTKLQQLAMVVLTGCTMIFSISPFTIMGVKIVNGSPQPVIGVGMVLFSLVSTVFSVGAIGTLFYKYRLVSSLQKTQILYVLMGILMMLGFITSTVLLPLLLFQTNLFVPFIPLYTLMFLVMTYIAIVRQRLMDIRVLVGRTIAFGILFILFVVCYTVFLIFFVDIFIDIYFSFQQLIAICLMILVAGLTFQPLRRYIEHLTNYLFFKNQYDTNVVIANLSKIMAYTLRLDDVTHQVLQELITQVHITKAAFVLFEDDSIADVRSEGYEVPPDFDENDMKILKHTRDMLVFDELVENREKSIMRTLGVSIVFHLRTEGKDIGLLLLGQKSSGEIYSDQDLQLFSILSSEIAVSIQNSLSYEQIRRFNITLQEKVDQATEDLQKANSRLEELDKLKDEFVSLASHELRTPLTAIRSYLWMALSGKGGEVTEKQRYYLDRSFNSANRLIKLVNSMLNISRIESGRMAIQFQRTPVIAMIQSVLSEVQPKAQELGLTITVEEHADVADVIADSDKIAEVLINLIGNSMKFTEKGGKITIFISQDQHFVHVAVSDTGVGIAPEHIEKLFTKFGALHTQGMTDAVAAQSTGLGLYISKSIVELHGGSIQALSEGVGKGATLSFTLPVFTKEKLLEFQKQYKTEGLGIIRSIIE